MQLLTLPVALQLSPEIVLTPGKYLSTDMVTMQLLLLVGDGTMEPLKEVRPLNPAGDYNGKKILIQRAGGFGDIILMTPVLREMKRRWPTCHISIACMQHYGVVLHGLPYIDELLPFPTPLEAAEAHDVWIFYENAIEKDPRAHELHMTDLFAEIAGLSMGDDVDRRPEYRVRPSEAIWANEAYPRNGNKRIAIQVAASGRCRRYHLLGDLLNELVKKGFEVFLLGTENDIPALRGKRLTPQIRNLTEIGLTFRQSCAVLNTVDCLIGPDSALTHIAGALNIPAVALYGAFPWKLRTLYSPSVSAIQGTGACSPCFHHNLGTMEKHFPDHCPSKEKGICQVMGTITPTRVIERVEKIMRTVAPVSDLMLPADGSGPTVPGPQG